MISIAKKQNRHFGAIIVHWFELHLCNLYQFALRANAPNNPLPGRATQNFLRSQMIRIFPVKGNLLPKPNL